MSELSLKFLKKKIQSKKNVVYLIDSQTNRRRIERERGEREGKGACWVLPFSE